MLPQKLSTGLPGLDQLLKGLLPGDNVVWQVDSVEDYRPFVEPFCAASLERGLPLVYFRFARQHDALVSPESGAQVRALHPEDGFETFISEVRGVIRAVGRGACYVFDCLSDLAVDWYSDQMLGNFFMLTCPYLFDMETVAYFAILGNNHSHHATTPIAETTQLWLDVFRWEGRLYVHPVKVQHRYSPTMYMLHEWKDDRFTPVTQSATIAEIMSRRPSLQLDALSVRLGVWHRTVLEAAEALDPIRADRCDMDHIRDVKRRLLRMAISREDRMVSLAERYLGPNDVLDVCKRMIGTGLIGGKAVGMLLARAILERTAPRWRELLEPHDSFYIGSDVFYTFLVRNGIWWVRERQRDPDSLLDDAGTARQRMLMGSFPEYIERRFSEMLDYFGQSPFIVRSSSLLEDNYGNAFAGKYESVFCVNQGPRHQRNEDFISAVRTIYASAISEKALRYRALRGLLDRDEQMALLVQRVSGSLHGNLFYPEVAGVGLSYNPYVWSSHIDPRAGALRIVFGLGTRAVDRSDDDYTRLVALNAADRRPEASSDEVRQYAQRKVDVLDMTANRLDTYHLEEVVALSQELQLEMFATRDLELQQRAQEHGVPEPFPWVLTFDRLLKETHFVADMREMLHILEDAYQYPVEVEFTLNFVTDTRYRINLLQCRPLQVKGGGAITDPPADMAASRQVLATCGPVIGQSVLGPVDRVIYVSPAEYGQLSLGQRYEVARLVARLAHAPIQVASPTILLAGPGRWATSTPSLGVPVTFADIQTVSVVCEIASMGGDLVPDFSLGTHFFNELIENDMLYLAVLPGRPGHLINDDLLKQLPNRLTELAPDAARWSEVVRVIEGADLQNGQCLRLHANHLTQRAVCYVAD